MEAAAGVAGVVKVAVAMKNGVLPATVNFNELNPVIKVEDSPFYIVDRTQPWDRLRDADGNEIPRRSGVSAFGFGGSNAHLAIEEYLDSHSAFFETDLNEDASVLIPLSAKNGERLKEYAEKLLAFLRVDIERSPADESIHHEKISATLQLGREAMETRIAFCIQSTSELVKRLERFVEGECDITGCWIGDQPDREIIQRFTNDETSCKQLDEWIAEKNYPKLAELWVKGVDLAWEKLYEGKRPQPISLPTYPFEKKRYWIPKGDEINKDEAKKALSDVQLHPLLHENTSDFITQRFTSRFTGSEFFFEEHVVNGQKILPGAACLEMVRAAVEFSRGESYDEPSDLTISNVAWLRPIIAGPEGIQIHIELHPQSNGDVDFSINSDANDRYNSHSSSLELVRGTVSIHQKKRAENLNIQSIRDRCKKYSLSAPFIYKTYQKMGIEYGPMFQWIREISVGEGEAIVRLERPETYPKIVAEFLLHPAQIDSVFQASLGLYLDSSDVCVPESRMAFSLKRFEIMDGCWDAVWVHVEERKNGNNRELNFTFYSEDGAPRIRIVGYVARTIEKDDLKRKDTTYYFVPEWQPKAIDKRLIDIPSMEKVIAVGVTDERLAPIRGLCPNVKSLAVRSNDAIDSLVEKLQHYDLLDGVVVTAHSGNPDVSAITCFRLIKALYKLGYGRECCIGLSLLKMLFLSNPLPLIEKVKP